MDFQIKNFPQDYTDFPSAGQIGYVPGTRILDGKMFRLSLERLAGAIGIEAVGAKPIIMTSSNAMPTVNNDGQPLVTGDWAIVGPGTYTNLGNLGAPDIVVPPSSFALVPFVASGIWGANSMQVINVPAGENGQDGASLLAPWSAGSYPLNAAVVLDDGETIVRNTIQGNSNNPNNNMVGWRKTGVTVSDQKGQRSELAASQRLVTSIFENVEYVNSYDISDFSQSTGFEGISIGASVTINNDPRLYSIQINLESDLFSIEINTYGWATRRRWYLVNNSNVILALGESQSNTSTLFNEVLNKTSVPSGATKLIVQAWTDNLSAHGLTLDDVSVKLNYKIIGAIPEIEQKVDLKADKGGSTKNLFEVESMALYNGSITSLQSIVLEDNICPSFKDTKEAFSSLYNINRDKFLFVPLINDKNKNLIGFCLDTEDSLPLIFSRASRAINLNSKGEYLEVGFNTPVASKIDNYYKLGVREPRRENFLGLGAIYQGYLGGSGGQAYNTNNLIRFQKNPNGENLAVLASNFFGDGTAADKLNFVNPQLLIPNKEYSFSITVKGIKGQTVAMFIKRNSGGTSAGRVNKIHTFSGEWERISLTGFIGQVNQIGINGGFGSTTTTTCTEFYYWAPQIEENTGSVFKVTSPIIAKPESPFQLNGNSNPTGSSTSGMPFNAEVYYPNDFLIDTNIVRLEGTNSFKFHFAQDPDTSPETRRRSELRCLYPSSFDGMWYSWSTYFPESYLPCSGEEVITQWRDSEDSGDYPLRSPSASIRTTLNNIIFRRAADSREFSPNNSFQESETYTLIENFQRNVWYDFIVKIKWDYTGVNSILEIWSRVDSNNDSDYVNILSLTGKRLGYNDVLPPVYKFGVYRSDNFKFNDGTNREVTERTIYHALNKCYYFNEEITSIQNLYTSSFDYDRTKLMRYESNIDTLGMHLIDNNGDMRHFWLY